MLIIQYLFNSLLLAAGLSIIISTQVSAGQKVVGYLQVVDQKTPTPLTSLEVSDFDSVNTLNNILDDASGNAYFLGNVGIGTGSIYSIGNNAMVFIKNNINGDNLYFGSEVLPTNISSGYFNLGLGTNSLTKVTTGSGNVALGGYTQENITGGTGNVSVGGAALAIGQNIQENTAVGNGAGCNFTGNSNSAFGEDAGIGFNPSCSPANTGQNNLFLGALTTAKNLSDSNEIVIGTNAIGNGPNSATIGNSNTLNIDIPYGNLGIGTFFGNSGLSVMNGNVGIGTWNPSYQLQTTGNIGVGTYTVCTTQGICPGSGGGGGSSSNYWLNTNNVGIGTYNNVGIGTISPLYQLTVGINPFNEISFTNTGGIKQLSGSTNTFTGSILAESAAPNIEMLLGSPNELAFGGTSNNINDTNNALNFVTNSNTNMLIDSGGNVGIDTINTQIGGGGTAQVLINGSSSTSAEGTLDMGSSIGGDFRLMELGYDQGNNVGWIQSEWKQNSAEQLSLNPKGGQVGVGFSNSTPYASDFQVDNVNSPTTSYASQPINTWLGQTNYAGIGDLIQIGFGGHSPVITSPSVVISYVETTNSPPCYVCGDIAFAMVPPTNSFNTTAIETARFTDYGALGIGTTHPSGRMEIEGGNVGIGTSLGGALLTLGGACAGHIGASLCIGQSTTGIACAAYGTGVGGICTSSTCC